MSQTSKLLSFKKMHMSVEVHQDLQYLIYCISFTEEVKGQNWYQSVFYVYVIFALRIWPYPWTVLFLKWLEMNNILFLYKDFKISRVKAPKRWYVKKRKKRHSRQMPVDQTLWRGGLPRGQGEKGGIQREMPVSTGLHSLPHWENARGLGMAVPSELTLTTWSLIINGAHSWRKHCSSEKHPYWRSNQKTQMYRGCLARGICVSSFLLSLPKSFPNISQYFLSPLGPKLPGSIQQKECSQPLGIEIRASCIQN